jgi:2'-5' RNA ligase
MRLFTAIDIPAEVKDKLRLLLARLKPLANLKWSPVDNLHITTKFIGEWPKERLEEMQEKLRAVAASGPIASGQIQVEVRGLGWFPSPHRPRVFWAGVHAEESLARLAHATEQAVAELGVSLEHRPYSPHLTLARTKDRAPTNQLRDAAAALESERFGVFRAREFYLFLSAGGEYTKLGEFDL